MWSPGVSLAIVPELHTLGWEEGADKGVVFGFVPLLKSAMTRAAEADHEASVGVRRGIGARDEMVGLQNCLIRNAAAPALVAKYASTVALDDDVAEQRLDALLHLRSLRDAFYSERGAALQEA
jgi:hypothetical protein